MIAWVHKEWVGEPATAEEFFQVSCVYSLCEDLLLFLFSSSHQWRAWGSYLILDEDLLSDEVAQPLSYFSQGEDGVGGFLHPPL